MFPPLAPIPWLKAVSIDQWRAIDRETDRLPEEAGATNLRVLAVMLTCAISLTLQEYFGSHDTFVAWFPNKGGHYWDLWSFAWWSGWRVFGYVLIPMAVLALLPGERIKKLDELIPAIEYFYSGELDYTPVLAEMKIPDVEGKDVGKALLALVEQFEAREGFDAKMLEEVARAWVEGTGWKSKNAFMLLRLAVTGRKASPPLFETMAVLGKEITRRRLRHAAQVVGK